MKTTLVYVNQVGPDLRVFVEMQQRDNTETWGHNNRRYVVGASDNDGNLIFTLAVATDWGFLEPMLAVLSVQAVQRMRSHEDRLAEQKDDLGTSAHWTDWYSSKADLVDDEELISLVREP